MTRSGITGDFGHGETQPELDTVATVQRGIQSCNLRTEHLHEGQLADPQHRDITSGGTRGDGALQADPPRPDNHHPLSLGECGLQRLAVVDVPQVPNTIQLCRPARSGAVETAPVARSSLS